MNTKGRDRRSQSHHLQKHPVAVSLVVVIFAATMPIAAFAGIFSLAFLPSWKSPSDITTNYTLHTYPFLQANASHIDPDAQGGLEPIEINEDGTAVVAHFNPYGGETTYIDDVPPAEQKGIYIVREGDTASEIALIYNISVETLRIANDLDNKATLKIGQELTIPPMDGLEVTVESGDTLSAIAVRYDADIQEIAEFNFILDEDNLQSGSTIFIPNGKLVASRRASSPTTASSSSSSQVSSTSGYFIKPLSRWRVTQREHGRFGALDIGGTIGDSVVAAASGTVIKTNIAGWGGGYGLYVVVEHGNGTQTLYAHLSRVMVHVGQKVQQGQKIGELGNTGRSTGPHLHFETRGTKMPF